MRFRAPLGFPSLGMALPDALHALVTKAGARGVQVVPQEADRRVDIVVDGQPFTSYIWPEALTKPVLFPLRTDRGTLVTCGFPLEPRPGGGRARQRRRDRSLPQQRRQGKRRRLGHAQPLRGPVGPTGGRGRHGGDLRPSQNPGAPTYWHARGHGLFAANPLGQAVFSNDRETLNFTLALRASALFRWRIAILSRAYAAAEIETLAKELAAER